ncbi:RecQ family ATP-dependent DNA helicase [Bacillus sp. DJP31]|uniref:RecQ family ATP-dependent DNA helicase n=1 Tax=Bacillus sp. DJP31 TaxID=3409789 RepID=UPI003BB78197
MQLEQILYEKFGFSTFREGQREIISDIVLGKNVVAMLPTGAGKSLCYLLPGYLKEGTVIIVSPLLSLMEDQVQQLQIMGEKRVVAINSFLSFEEKRSTFDTLHQYKFIFVSPEMLQSTHLINKLRKINISLFVVDEAHCISQWGHEFRTDYLKLSGIIKQFKNPPCLALTATATEKVIKDIVASLHVEEVKYHLYSIDRPNISINVEKTATINDKKNQLLQWVQRLEGPGMIYFSSRKWAESICSFLKSEGIGSVAYYHGGMESEQRMLIQQQFLANQLQIICCTNAFGMGVNKPNVRYVIHFHLPSQMESYIQEIGRAGRDGKNSLGILLYSPTDQELPEALIQQEFPSKDELEHLLTLLKDGFQEDQLINEEWLLSHSTINDTMWRFIKYQLEIRGMIQQDRLLTNLNVAETQKEISFFIQERLAYKHGKLDEMKRWIHSPTCRRSAYLTIFNEQLVHPVKQCCDICLVDYSLFEKTNETLQDNVLTNWEQELHAIFLKESGKP